MRICVYEGTSLVPIFFLFSLLGILGTYGNENTTQACERGHENCLTSHWFSWADSINPGLFLLVGLSTGAWSSVLISHHYVVTSWAFGFETIKVIHGQNFKLLWFGHGRRQVLSRRGQFKEARTDTALATRVCIGTIPQILPKSFWETNSFLVPHRQCLVGNGPHRDKTCLRGFRQSDIQISLLSSATETSWNIEISLVECLDIIFSVKRTTKALIRLRICAGWCAP